MGCTRRLLRRGQGQRPSSESDCCAGGKVNDRRPGLGANARNEQRLIPVIGQHELMTPGCGSLRVIDDIKTGEEVLARYGRRYRMHSGHGESYLAQ